LEVALVLLLVPQKVLATLLVVPPKDSIMGLATKMCSPS